ncbi:MAG TPA: tetratricopeptide repeat protein [Acidobacteriota bacterium]|jgi:tetratricopeptide (TPR) repeat protein
MKQTGLRTLVAFLSIAATLLATSVAQTGGGHTLFGDFKVDERRVAGLKPQVFQISLCREGGSPITRQSISNNGRYRFLDVRNGAYDIVVELAGQEVARVHVVLADSRKTDIRHDIFLEWHQDMPASEPAKAGVVSAIDGYTRVPSDQTRFLQAEERIEKRDYAQAIALLEQLVAADPKDFEAWTELGTADFRLERVGEAEKAYLKALQERPSFFPAVLNLGKLYLVQKKNGDAVTVLSRAVELRPESADANFFLGESYLQVKKGSKAVGYLKEALRLDPVGKAEAHLRLAALYNAAGMKDRAAAEYELFLQKRPDYPDRQKLQRYVSENKKP